jgi:hypothetical protein
VLWICASRVLELVGGPWFGPCWVQFSKPPGFDRKTIGINWNTLERKVMKSIKRIQVIFAVYFERSQKL